MPARGSKSGDLCRVLVRRAPSVLPVILLSVALLVAGCGGSDRPCYGLWGKVTYDGTAVPAGQVTWVPDTTQENSGSTVSLQIRDGKFDTRHSSSARAGHVGGPYLVRVTGLDGIPRGEFPAGVPLFPTYELRIDLPSKDLEQQIVVPTQPAMRESAASEEY